MPNRLANETSPYLLQHAHNPVDWHPWGDAAIERARREGKPILLSIGYSACHWCHVMERESFEDAETARVMNAHFVSIKVDREERPDIDAIYMQAVQAMTGHGGWPMTVFLTPELEPFWGGTYFPPQDRPGMPSFRRVMDSVADAFHNRPDDVRRVASTMRTMYAASTERTRGTGALSADLLLRAKRGLLGQRDATFGGFGDAPKFPQAMAMEFLLTQWARTDDAAALDTVKTAFLRMARGGIYDQVGGGFARYSVDERWLVPHFEKMLYDNALLTRVGVHLWQATQDGEVRRVCEETLTWLAREMTSPSGGFFATLDADSEGEEGRFYLWDERELRALLGADADALIAYWGVSGEGNFEGRNILHVDHDRDAVARSLGLSVDALSAKIASGRRTLYAARAKRVWPARDEKVLAAWNGLMLRGLAEAARAFNDPGYREQALRSGEFLFREMVRDGRVFRSHKDGATRIAGFLEDYAAVALGVLALYELTFERRWLDRAHSLADAIARRFWDPDVEAFFDTASDHEALITRPRDTTDNATPAGTSLAIELFLKLGDLVGNADLSQRANAVLATQVESMARYPLAFGHALSAADMAVFGAVEVAIVGEPGAADFAALTEPVATRYVPSLVLAGGRVAESGGIGLLVDRTTRDGRATAYLCKGYVCEQPASDARELGRHLDRLIPPTARP